MAAKQLRSNLWWLAPQAIPAAILTVTVGLWGVWVVYVLVNSGLVWMFADEAGPNKWPRLQLAFKVLAIAFVPTGFMSMLVSGGEVTIADKAGAASPDENVRKATSATSFRQGGQK